MSRFCGSAGVSGKKVVTMIGRASAAQVNIISDIIHRLNVKTGPNLFGELEKSQDLTPSKY